MEFKERIKNLISIVQERPLVFIDLETTGTNPQEDRVVEISIIKIEPGGNIIEKCRRVNPKVEIPKSASDIHGITNEDVSSEPSFGQLSKAIHSLIKDCDLAGYNSNRFDIPLLMKEFDRCGVALDVLNVNPVDVYELICKFHQRTLSNMYLQYTNKTLENSHSATSDNRATIEILSEILKVHYDEPQTVKNLSKEAGKKLDFFGNIIEGKDGEPVFSFGKHSGTPIQDLPQDYIQWVLRNPNFPDSTKLFIRKWVDRKTEEGRVRND